MGCELIVKRVGRKPICRFPACRYNLACSKQGSNFTQAGFSQGERTIIKKRLVPGLIFWIFTACNLASTSSATPPTNTPAPLLPTSAILRPVVLTQYLENVHIVKVDTLDDPSEWNATGEILNGTLLLVGAGGNDWHGVSNHAIFREGAGIVINFRFSPGEFFEMYFEQGPWTTSLYKRFGVYVNEDHSTVNIFSGRDRRNPARISGNLSLVPGIWYSLLLVIGQGGDFLAVIWDRAYLDQSLQYREIMADWKGTDWTFRIQVNKGTIVFDDFAAIAFDGIQ